MKRQYGIALSVLLILALMISVFAGTLAMANGNDDKTTDQPALPDETEAHPTHSLTIEEEQIVQKIVFSDSDIKKLIDGKSYKVISVGAWARGGKNIGGCMEILFDEAFDADQKWPCIVGEDKTGKRTFDYEMERIQEAVRVKKLNIRVDFSRGKIVDINPLPFGTDLSQSPPAPVAKEDDQHTHNLQYISTTGGDYAYNYDFRSQYVSVNNIDWPVTIILYGPGATVSNIKNLLDWPNSGGTMYHGLYDDGMWEWDNDEGEKTNGITSCHVRLYADSGDYSYNSTYTKYVLATTHYDRYEGWPWPWDDEYGWSEDSANEVIDRLEDQGCTLQSYESGKWLYFNNTEYPAYWCDHSDYGGDSDCYYQSDGWAKAVYVPAP